MDVWAQFAWCCRTKYAAEKSKKYRGLVFQPTIIRTDNEQFLLKLINLLWTIGRGFADGNVLEGENFGDSVGMALKLCLDQESADYSLPLSTSHAAARNGWKYITRAYTSIKPLTVGCFRYIRCNLVFFTKNERFWKILSTELSSLILLK